MRYNYCSERDLNGFTAIFKYEKSDHRTVYILYNCNYYDKLKITQYLE